MGTNDASLASLPEVWREAFRRDAQGARPPLADPLPERRVARLLWAFIGTGLLFMLLPGTLMGVWNLAGINSQRQLEAVSAAWIQAHGHAQLPGWVGTFLIGISLYALPKFRGALLRSIPLGWAMLAMWSFAIGARWLAGVEAFGWQLVWPASAVLELTVAILLIWQCTVTGPSRKKGEAWETLVFTGFSGLVLTLAWQLVLVLRPLAEPALPTAEGRLLISLALWIFCLPVVLGFSARFFPGLLFTPQPSRTGARITLALLIPAALGYAIENTLVAASATLAAVLAGTWSIRVFQPSSGKPKTSGVDPLYPVFARVAYVWLIVSAALGFRTGAP